MKKVALITGGSRGIGFGIARELAKIGFDLAINGVRDQSQVQDVLKTLQSSGSEVVYCQGDISIATDRAKVIQKTKDTFGRLNVLVNNAGVAPEIRADMLDASEESFDRVLSTNLKGPYFLTQQVSKWMIEQKNNALDFSGCIITISSISATVASVNRGEYCISKAGLSMLTTLFATRLGAHDIPVYEVRPGIIDTDMTSGAKEKYDKLIAEGLCIQQRWGTPDDVGKAVGALVAYGFPYATGQVIMIDGGLTIQRL